MIEKLWQIEESDAKLQLEQLLNDPCSSTFSSADTKIVSS